MTERKKKRRWFGNGGGDAALWAADLDGILFLLGLLIAVALGWVFVELLVPALLIGTYLLVIAALRRVANDEHGCEGRLGKAMLWGTIWATVYTLPLAALVWVAHAILRR